MIKKLLSFFGLITFFSFNAQNNFEYTRTWGTYFPGQPLSLVYYNNSIYFYNPFSAVGNQISITTPNAFQSSPAVYNIQKFDASNGNRVWGTYYGHNDGTSAFNSIGVNETGIYILGDTSSTAANQGYFATPGAFQMINKGNRDLFLSKFSHDGTRLWSTYFGGTGLDHSYAAMQALALNGSDIYFTGWTYGNTENLATHNSYKSSPTQSTGTYTNHFFAKFNSNGQRIWSSYYGDSNNGYNLPINIAINNSSLYLYGETITNTGYATPTSWQTQIIDPNPTAQQQKNTAFLAKFDLKTLATSEVQNNQKLILYDNPNNGNFSLKGDILEKENCILKIYDMSGKLIHSKTLEKKKLQNIELKGQLPHGNYIIQVNDSKNNSLENFKMIVKN